MEREPHTRIRELILAVVPADGRSIGNMSLCREVRQALEVDGGVYEEATVNEVREQLIAEGVLGKGRGRGGSVYRIDRTAREAGRPDQESPDSSHGKTSEAPASGDSPYGSYQHADQATLRPEVGLQDQFYRVREPKTYRYDSSLAPELVWDDNAEREIAEWLLNLVAEAGEKGEEVVFAESQRWKGTGETFRSSRECVARLRGLSRPFLNWAGKAERQQISVPTVPLFVH